MWNVLLQLWHFVRKLEKRFFYIYEFQFTMLQLVIHSTNKSCPFMPRQVGLGAIGNVLCSLTIIITVNLLAIIISVTAEN